MCLERRESQPKPPPTSLTRKYPLQTIHHECLDSCTVQHRSRRDEQILSDNIPGTGIVVMGIELPLLSLAGLSSNSRVRSTISSKPLCPGPAAISSLFVQVATIKFSGCAEHSAMKFGDQAMLSNEFRG
jgi:hypothetical protein